MTYEKRRNGVFKFISIDSKERISERYVELRGVAATNDSVSVIIHKNSIKNSDFSWSSSEPLKVRLKWLQTDLLLEHNRVVSFVDKHAHLYADFMKEQIDDIDHLPVEDDDQEIDSDLEHCHETGKKKFRSRKSARNAFADKSARLRTYVCPFCKKWHMTNPDKR